jgi:hypothetical protein
MALARPASSAILIVYRRPCVDHVPLCVPGSLPGARATCCNQPKARRAICGGSWRNPQSVFGRGGHDNPDLAAVLVHGWYTVPLDRLGVNSENCEECLRCSHLFGERAGTRTRDLLIKSQLLYRLSYALVTMRKILPVDAVSIPKKAPGQAFHRARGSV